MRILAVFLFLALVPAGLNAAGPDSEVVIISPHWDGIKDETARAFDAWHRQRYGRPAVIRWYEAGGGTSQITRLLVADYKSNPSSGIDVLYGGGVEPFVSLEKDQLLTRYDPPPEVLAQIPAQLSGMPLYDPAHEWFGAALSGFGIIVNERARAAAGLPEVRTWSDLADPRLANWISSPDPRASGSALTIYEIILQAYGWDKGWATLMAMSANTRGFLSSAAAEAVEVGLGDAAYGIAIDQYGQAQEAYYGHDNVRFIIPEGQTVITPDSIAILKNPPHPEFARHFLEFVLSREGQLLWMLPRGAPGGATSHDINRMSVMPALYSELAGRTPVHTDPFTLRYDLVYSSELGSKRRTILSAMIAAWMIDTHDQLTRAWKAVNSQAAQKLAENGQGRLIAELLAPPLSEAQVLDLAAHDGKDQVKRTALINGWQAAALDRYKRILAQAPRS